MFIVGGERSLREAVQRVLAEATGAVRDRFEKLRSFAQLSAEVEELKIEKARREEEFARREREIEHKIGLERKRQEQELGLSKREASVSIREENLKADRERFESQMAFHEKRFTEEVGYLKSIIGDLAERLPTQKITEKRGR